MRMSRRAALLIRQGGGGPSGEPHRVVLSTGGGDEVLFGMFYEGEEVTVDENYWFDWQEAMFEYAEPYELQSGSSWRSDEPTFIMPDFDVWVQYAVFY